MRVDIQMQVFVLLTEERLEKFSNLDLGFRKVDSERWEFANEGFLRGQKHLLKTIRRRTHSHPPPMNQQSSNQFVEDQQSRLRHDKSVLMTELVELRQEQQNNRAHIKSLEKRLQGTEQKQQQMMAFFAQLIRHPDFGHQLLQQKKRRRSTDQGSFYGDEGASRSSSSSSSSHDLGTTVKVESEELRVFNRYQISELDILALEIQGFGNREGGGEHDNLGGGKDEGEMNDW